MIIYNNNKTDTSYKKGISYNTKSISYEKKKLATKTNIRYQNQNKNSVLATKKYQLLAKLKGVIPFIFLSVTQMDTVMFAV